MKPSINNPFVTYGYKGPDYFCDREEETRKLMRALANERNVTLIAPRRMGKTGLIHHVFNAISNENAEIRCFYLDILGTRSLQQFVELFASKVIGKLETPTQQVLARLTSFFSRWRPKIELDPFTGTPSLGLDIAPSEARESLQSVFEYLRQSGRRCYVAIDEFQQILAYNDEGVEALIRSYVQFLPNVYFIFAGSEQHMMEEMFLSAKHPFYLSSQILSLGPIDREAYYDFANAWFCDASDGLPREVFDLIYDTAEGVTWYVQGILNRLYEFADSPQTIDLARRCVYELVDEQEQVFQNYCAWLTENQLAVLRAIAIDAIVKAPLSHDFISRHRLPSASSVKTSLTSLLDKQLIVSTPQGYKLTDLFFRIWLARKA